MAQSPARRSTAPHDLGVPATIVVGGAAVLAAAGAAVGVPIAAAHPALLPAIALLGAGALCLVRAPRWIVPCYLALVWTLIPADLFGGLPSPIEAGGLALLGLAIWRAPRHPELTRTTLLVMALFAFPLVATWALAEVPAPFPMTSLRDLSFLAIAALGLSGLADVDRAVRAIAVVGLALGVGALFSVYVTPTELFPLETDPFGDEAKRAIGPFGEANFFALSLAATAPMQYFVAIRGGAWRLIGFAGLIAVLGGIVATGSRGGMIAALVGVALSIVFSGSLGESGRRARVVGLAGLAGAVLLLPTLSAQIESSTQRTVSGRATENRIAIEVFRDRPVVGVGPGVYPLLYRDYARDIGNDPRPERAAHNLYLQILAEQGIAGAIGWLAAAITVGTALMRHRGWQSPAGQAVILSIAAYGIASIFLHGETLRLLFILAGMALAIAYADDRNDEENVAPT